MKVVGPDSGEWRGMVDLLALRRSREAFESRILPRVPPNTSTHEQRKKKQPRSAQRGSCGTSCTATYSAP